MSNYDYREGYRDGFRDGINQTRLEREALDGPDMTMYYFIGGPKHGLNLRTGGVSYFYIPEVSSSYINSNYMDYQIERHRYEKTRTTKGDTVYLYRGVTVY